MSFNVHTENWECNHFMLDARPQGYCWFCMCQLDTSKAVSPCNENNPIKNY